MKALPVIIIIFFALPFSGSAQSYFDVSDDAGAGNSHRSLTTQNERGESNTKTWGRREKKKEQPTPKGVSQWVVDPLLGDSIAAANNDTVVHNFQWWNLTDGKNGEYTFLGNLGAPRLSRIFLHRDDTDEMLFLQSYDFFLTGVKDFRFSNTKSPLTNLAYHKVGNKTNGQERVRGYFSTNITAHSGAGFLLDYLYGRGYYNAQANSMFGGSVFGYHLGERYQMHAYINANHNKMGENGGLESDVYITDPQSLPNRYSSKDIPTTLTQTWNRNDGETYFLTHRYRMGHYREIHVPDSLKPKMPAEIDLLNQLNDSLRQLVKTDSLQRKIWVDSLQRKWQAEQIPPTEFVPVASVGHTFSLRTMRHVLYSYDTPQGYYTHLYYGSLDYARNRAHALVMDNTLSLNMIEGFNKWAAMGISLFATHHMERYHQPHEMGDTVMEKRETLQKLYVGGRLSRRQGKLLHYDAQARFVAVGDHMGEFDADANISLNFPLGRRDSIELHAHGFVKNLQPVYYMESYHNQFLWWDHDFNKEFKTRIEGSVTNKRTKTTLSVGVENIKNYTYLAAQNTLTGKDPNSTLTADYSHNVDARQYSGNIQVFSVGLKQDFKLGPLHWDNEITYQTTSKADILPLPKLNVYSNLYLKFCIKKTLNVQLGGDVRYFTSYYAPDYSPAANQFVVQDTQHPRIKIGNYPVLSAYANLHIQHCRIYVAGHHLNSGMGKGFWAPHYAMDPWTLRFGVSWNFFN